MLTGEVLCDCRDPYIFKISEIAHPNANRCKKTQEILVLDSNSAVVFPCPLVKF